MTASRHGARLIAAVAGALVLQFTQVAIGADYDFMPKGGRALLLEMLGAPPNTAELRAIVQARRTEAEWRDFIAARTKALSEQQLATLAGYLVINMPLPEDAMKRGDLVSALPPDGRDLAWNGCQGCHSLFASHLTQSRDVQAWRNVFLSPFHRELKMSPQEREEFSRYSAINMPMKIEDVPPDLRF